MTFGDFAFIFPCFSTARILFRGFTLGTKLRACIGVFISEDTLIDWPPAITLNGTRVAKSRLPLFRVFSRLPRSVFCAFASDKQGHHTPVVVDLAEVSYFSTHVGHVFIFWLFTAHNQKQLKFYACRRKITVSQCHKCGHNLINDFLTPPTWLVKPHKRYYIPDMYSLY